MPDQQPIPVGEFVGDYKIIEHLGTGGFGITYRVADPSLNVEFALKEYFPWEFAARDQSGNVLAASKQQEQFRWGLEKFKAEGQTLAALSLRHDASPYIVKVFRFFEARRTAYILQEFVQGVPLLQHVAKANSPKDIENLFYQLCDGLSYVHRQGMCHLDVKPDNILIARDTGKPKLIDFGSAKRQDTGRTVALITPAFSAVEQYSADAEHGPYTDIYALATTFYRALTGENPPDAPTRVLEDKCRQMLDQQGFSSFTGKFLKCIDLGMRVMPSERPDTVKDWLRAAETGPVIQRTPSEPEAGSLIERQKRRAVEEEREAATHREGFGNQEPRPVETLIGEQRANRILRNILLGTTLFVGLIAIYAGHESTIQKDSTVAAESVSTKPSSQTRSEPVPASGQRIFSLDVSPQNWSEFKLHDKARAAGYVNYKVLVVGDGRFIGKAGDRLISVREPGLNYGEPPKSLKFKSLEDTAVKVTITIEEK
jgi:serine/threonine protein kinase